MGRVAWLGPGLAVALLLDAAVGVDDPNDPRVRQIDVLGGQAERDQLVGMVLRAELVIGAAQVLLADPRRDPENLIGIGRRARVGRLVELRDPGDRGFPEMDDEAFGGLNRQELARVVQEIR